ncbi:MAG: hypothetical protein Q7R45_09010, partial [Sulfuricaulis sp.]|nr:hypothetical protein [Sulfuricaulis sp.]
RMRKAFDLQELSGGLPLRDGAILYADIFRPDSGVDRFPAIMNIGPYHKDRLWIPPDDLEEKANPHLAWETANPVWRCARGYRHYHANYNIGAQNTVYAGGDKVSHLLLPVIPAVTA